MSDVTTNYDLEKQGMELESFQLQLNVKSQQYRIAQLHDEERRIEENITATNKALAELDKKINSINNK